MKITQHLKITSIASITLLLNSCGMISESNSRDFSTPMLAPSVSSSGSASSKATKGLNRDSVSTKKRQIVKKGNMSLNADKVRETGETIEKITLQNGGHINSMSEQEGDSKYANFELYVPALNLVPTMDEISELGKVTYRKISAKDVTKDVIRFKTRLANLKQRRSRIQALYKASKTVEEKLEIESTLSELESQIYEMEESVRQMQKVAHFSKLSISITQSTIRGPLGVVKDSGSWLFAKLFTIRE